MKTKNTESREKQAQAESAVVNVDDCYFQWRFNDGTRCDDLWKAHAEKKDVWATVIALGNPDRIIFSEHRSFCHIDDAWRILAGGRFGKWKTTKLLITLRQALRERYVQCMPLDIPPVGISERELKKWLAIARHYDAVHHGIVTF